MATQNDMDKAIAESQRIQDAATEPFPWGNLFWLLILIGGAAVLIASMGG